MKITPQEFRTLAEYIHRKTGIDLKPEKAYLVENRLSPLLSLYDCSTFSEFYYKLTTDSDEIIKDAVVDAITTQETLFFRDGAPFEMLKYKIIPELIDRKKSDPAAAAKPAIPIRILSAACSTGQEAYSIAISFDQAIAEITRCDIQVLGIDISDHAVARASYAHFNNFEISRGLSEELIQKYFIREQNQWRVIDRIRSMCSFKKFNLVENTEPIGTFDIIFCRNMAIYFSQERKVEVFNRLADMLNPGGCLIIGSSEYLAGICDRFYPQRHLKSVYYTLDPGAANLDAQNRKNRICLGANI